MQLLYNCNESMKMYILVKTRHFEWEWIMNDKKENSYLPWHKSQTDYTEVEHAQLSLKNKANVLCIFMFHSVKNLIICQAV